MACVFENDICKIVDITPYLQSEVFKPLIDYSIFKQVQNNHYFVSWLNEEIDLSADTLWHIGVEVDAETFATV